MSNLAIYEAVRVVPAEAQKEIKGGRLKGKTDINPMWRIKKLTEEFGPCGTGWYYTIDRQWLEPGSGGEIAAFCDISLFIADPESGEWSMAIPGTGGSMFVAKETGGLYVSDECYKMALTDALSVACKALGMGADVYWDKDSTKYTGKTEKDEKPPEPEKPPEIICADCKLPITTYIDPTGKTVASARLAKSSEERFGRKLCAVCARRAARAEAERSLDRAIEAKAPDEDYSDVS